ncbi:inositol monophosphatase family protein [Microlunatus speluncae]|uniref:inositol monophosphatase family protein n=1 Tax=Microlunatus speluncae TaxID=2594267 RepID=UPI001266194F|nr:inositol monophosphatase family protein [Microlunatus speluncae]
MTGLAGVHPALADTCRAATDALAEAQRRYGRDELSAETRIGADGTPTMLIDDLVEARILDVARGHGVNVLSEEAGFVDRGSALTLVVDPVDGSANAAAGVPLSCYSAALLDDGRPVEALTCWLETGRTISARVGRPVPYRTSGARRLAGRALSMLRPKVGARGDTADTWLRLSRRAGRVRILSSSCLEAMLVATGAIDAFADPGSDTHRLVDLAAAMVIMPAAGGFVGDAFGRPLVFDHDLTLRYSGVVAATEELAAEIVTEIRAGDEGSRTTGPADPVVVR